jgi:TctA family transporter
MAESSFRQAMLLSNGSISIFWSNGLVASIMGLAMIMLFWPLISRLPGLVSRRGKSRAASDVAE